MAEDKELKIELSDQVREQMAADPAMAEALREMMAAFHQANDAVQRGQYETMEDAIEAITGNRPAPVDLDQPSMNEVLGLGDDEED